ncbi:glycoside hydrolase family 3 N-terminal domain-containing protein, partial [Arsenicicoccus bolidensis]
ASTAFTRGMADAGVAATAKHFPGLGLVSDNTDTTDVVTDTSTDASSPSLGTFKAQVEAGVPLVMMSSARYARIDPGVPAMMSPRVVGLVRALGFRGVVITDDLGRARAARVFSPDELATRSVAAGVDVLLTTIPEGVPTMVQALMAQARRDRGFDDRVRRAALTVLETKARQGLLPPRC